VFDKFPKYHTKIVLEDLSVKVSREVIFKPSIGNESIYEISNDNAVRVINVDTSKNLTVKNTMFPHRNIHIFILTSPDGKTHNQTIHILKDRKRRSSVLNVRSFRAADCDTAHSLVVTEFRERLTVSKQTERIAGGNNCSIRQEIPWLLRKFQEPALCSQDTKLRQPKSCPLYGKLSL
jgi:hypothetical protein